MQHTVERSTTSLVAGLLFSAGGAFLLLLARDLEADWAPAVTAGEPGTNPYLFAMILGVLALLIGLPTFVVGVVRLSRNVDLAAQAAAELLASRASAAEESPTDA